jgi:glycosyltransferase involved in cell wall biosynthesis
MIAPCLELLGFCDEIVVVVDSRTTDGTEAIARRYTEHVFRRDFDNFSGQKNAAIDACTGDWVLIVDADERVPPELADEIGATIRADPPYEAFDIETLNVFMGSFMRHGGWQEHHTRLIRRGAVRYRNDLHEEFEVRPGRLGRLEHGMWHFSHRSIRDNLLKTANYNAIEARAKVAAGARPVRPRTLFWVIFKEFVNRFVYRRGYRDGMVGVIESLYQPFSKFALHVELWEQQQKPSIPEQYAELERRAIERRT